MAFLLPSPAGSVATGASPWGLHAPAVFALAKPRLAAMSVLTAMAAYVTAHGTLAGAGPTMLGTTLSAAGALSLNQWRERRADALMQRTRGRPLPRGQLTAAEALQWSIGFSVAGVLLLGLTVNLAAAACAAATILVYGAVYTPLKKRTRWATEIGALSGALPALLGNAAAGNLLAPRGLVLAGILLLWQMPHFFAIGWRHRADYRAAGFALLPAVDPDGARTAAWSLFYTAALALFAGLAWGAGWLALRSGAATLCANLWFCAQAVRFCRRRARDASARRLFLTSIFHLPAVLGALLADAAP